MQYMSIRPPPKQQDAPAPHNPAWQAQLFSAKAVGAAASSGEISGTCTGKSVTTRCWQR